MERDWGEYILKLYDKDNELKEEENTLNFLTGHDKAKEWEEKDEGNVSVLFRVLYHTNERKKWDYKPPEDE